MDKQTLVQKKKLIFSFDLQRIKGNNAQKHTKAWQTPVF